MADRIRVTSCTAVSQPPRGSIVSLQRMTPDTTSPGSMPTRSEEVSRERECIRDEEWVHSSRSPRAEDRQYESGGRLRTHAAPRVPHREKLEATAAQHDSACSLRERGRL